MISRARSLGGFLVLRPATRNELSTRPPQYLVDELDRLSRLEKESHKDLVKYMESLPIDLPPKIMDILRVGAPREQIQQVKEARTSAKSTIAAETASSHFVTKKRIFGKTTPEHVVIHSSNKKKMNECPQQAESPPAQVASTSSGDKRSQNNVTKNRTKSIRKSPTLRTPLHRARKTLLFQTSMHGRLPQ